MDFIVARFGNIYGYIATGKDRAVGFMPGYKETLDHLKKKDENFTYAKPDELAVHEHQRDWTAKDRIYYNKLKHYKEIDTIQFFNTLRKAQGRC